MEVSFLVVSLGVVVWAVMSQSALRNYRWTRLTKLVGDPARQEEVEDALKDERALHDSLLVLRLLASIVAILLIAGSFGGDANPGLSEDPWSFVADLGLVILIFLVGVHGIARGLVRAAPERTLLLLLPTMRIASRVCLPLRWILAVINSAVTRIIGVKEDAEDEQAREEILDAVSEGEREGAIDDDEREMIESIIEFSDQEVAEVMTPRTSVFGIKADTPIDQAVDMVLDSGHSRVPVYSEDKDNVLGVLYAKDLLTLWRDRSGPLPHVSELLRKPHYVPETKNISDLLKELRRGKVHMAIVLDEYGGMAGVVTIEDILEEIVGEIEDEYDHDEDGGVHGKFSRISESEVEVSARIDVEELNEAVDIELPDEDSYETLGGFLFTQLGRVPAVGEKHEFDGVLFEVIDADERRINRVRVVVGQREA